MTVEAEGGVLHLEAKGCCGHQSRGRQGGVTPLQASEREGPCGHLESHLLTSRTAREQIRVVLVPHPVRGALLGQPQKTRRPSSPSSDATSPAKASLVSVESRPPQRSPFPNVTRAALCPYCPTRQWGPWDGRGPSPLRDPMSQHR